MNLPIRTRLGNGFWKEVENHSETHCDYCGEAFSYAPGGDIMCNNWEPDHDQSGRYDILKEKERRNNVTVWLTKDNVEGVYRLEWVRATSDLLANNGAVGEETYQTFEAALANFEGAFERHALKAA